MHALREGFTTGTAAAASASAAVSLLLGQPLPAVAEVTLPPFAENGTPLAPDKISRESPFEKTPSLVIPIEHGDVENDIAFASVVKDGGDDPDATHGAHIVVHASLRCFSVEAGKNMGASPHRPGWIPAHPKGPPVEMRVFSRLVYIYGGKGVGRVTLPGLPVAVGEPAVNPEPRRQIAFAASQTAQKLGYDGPLHLIISVPDGLKRAEHTLNARLGIMGGISILGTRGTVRPYSHEAWKATISQGLGVAEALGLRTVMFSTGRRSERLGFALYPALSEQAGIQVADYAAFSLREASLRPFSQIIWVCFPGKLLKLAQGLEWTHAKTAPADIAPLAEYWRESGGAEDLLPFLRSMPTAAGAFALMEKKDAALRDAVLRRLAHAAMESMQSWLAPVPRTSSERPKLVLHVFSTEEQLLLTLKTD